MIVQTLFALAVQGSDDLAAGGPGRRLLAGEVHGPVVTVEPERGVGPVPAGTARLFLVERPRPVSEGCVRRRWSVAFATRGAASMDAAKVKSRYAFEEVRVCIGGSCDRATFVDLFAGAVPLRVDLRITG